MDTTDSPRASFTHLPMWAQVAYLLGVPSGIAVFLVWFLSGAVLQALHAHAEESRAGITKQVQLLQQICVNTASTPEERASCWGIGR
jgi:hypothetical protein